MTITIQWIHRRSLGHEYVSREVAEGYVSRLQRHPCHLPSSFYLLLGASRIVASTFTSNHTDDRTDATKSETVVYTCSSRHNGHNSAVVVITVPSLDNNLHIITCSLKLPTTFSPPHMRPSRMSRMLHWSEHAAFLCCSIGWCAGAVPVIVNAESTTRSTDIVSVIGATCSSWTITIGRTAHTRRGVPASCSAAV